MLGDGTSPFTNAPLDRVSIGGEETTTFSSRPAVHKTPLWPIAIA